MLICDHLRFKVETVFSSSGLLEVDGRSIQGRAVVECLSREAIGPLGRVVGEGGRRGSRRGSAALELAWEQVTGGRRRSAHRACKLDRFV